MRRVCDVQQRTPSISGIAQRAIGSRALALDEVARITGLSPATLLYWEDEAHLFTSQRRGSQRRYDNATFQTILTIQRFVGAGVSLAHVQLFLEEEERRARLIPATPFPQPSPLATTQHFLSALRRVDAHVFAHLHAMRDDPHSTPEEALALIARELVALQPAFGAHELLFWLRRPDGTWPAGPVNCTPTQRSKLERAADRASAGGKMLTRAFDAGRTVTLAPVTSVGAECSVVLLIRGAAQPLDTHERAILEYIAHRLTHFYHSLCCWLRDRQEARFDRMVLNVLPQPLILRDREGDVLFFNESAEDLAQNAAEIDAARAKNLPLPNPIWATALPDGAPLDVDHAPSMCAIRAGDTIRDMQMMITQPADDVTGEIVTLPAMATAIPLFNADGQAACSVTIVQDMSTPAQMQRLKDNVVRRVHHQIQNGMTAIRGFSQTVERLCQRVDEQGTLPSLDEWHAKVRVPARTITQQTRSVEKWANELRELDNYALGRPETCSLAQQVQECIDEMRVAHPDYRFSHETEAGDTVLEGHWVPSDICFIITNLIENAIKYSPPHTEVSVFLSRVMHEDVPTAQMIVRDQGMGIPPADYERIFENGTRLGQVDAEGNPIPGTGKGLHLCRIYTMRYEGKIYPRASKAGPGTDFVVKLPLLR